MLKWLNRGPVLKVGKVPEAAVVPLINATMVMMMATPIIVCFFFALAEIITTIRALVVGGQ